MTLTEEVPAPCPLTSADTGLRTPLPKLATDVLLLQLLLSLPQIFLGLSVTSSLPLSPGRPSTGRPAPVGVSNDDSQVR